MSQIIKPSTTEVITRHYLCFTLASDSNMGYSFLCDEKGRIHEQFLNPMAKANLQLCLDGFTKDGIAILPAGVQHHSNTVRNPAILKCDCRRNLALWTFTNECECGRLYNSAGQGLVPREQWYS